MDDVRTQFGNGLLITFEGDDGAGKSTHIRFLANILESMGYEVLRLREPGGTAIGEALRDIVLDPNNDAMDSHTELLIYEAARAQIVAQVIAPALKRGAVVLCDRFSDSTIAYQGYGRGLPIDRIREANAFACQGIVPDKTILLTCDELAVRAEKRAQSEQGLDRLEQAGGGFHAKVSAGFRELAAEEPDRFVTVASQPLPSATSRAILDGLACLFPWLAEYADAAGPAFDALDARVLYDAQDVPAQTFAAIAQTVRTGSSEGARG